MASISHCAFSHDTQYLAFCSTDGKLKIWETSTNRLKQEFVPNLHLSSPCSVLEWITVGTQSTTAASPWKKRRKKSVSEDAEHKEIIAMGSANGSISLYDISTSSISDKLTNGHSSTVTALTWSHNAGFFTAAEDKHIIEWNLQDKSVKCKWKSGKSTALTVLPEGKSLLSGDKKIKWWDLETKQILGTFTGHANQVTALRCAKVGQETSYLFSSASGDDYLSVWSLNEVKKDKMPVGTLILPDEVLSFSIRATKESHVMVLSVTRSGHAQIFKYQPNGTSTKPSKPTLNVWVTADAGQKESVQQIPILIANLTEDLKMVLAYGSFLGLTIEKVEPDFSDGVQCLVRTNLKKTKEKKEEAVTKVKNLDINNDKVEYIGPADVGSSTLKRTKSGPDSQIPLQSRLDNLSLNAEASTPDRTTSKGDNMAQLLMQGLHSEDKDILSSVLLNKRESVIKNTVAKLPVQAIVPLLKELTTMLEGKTFPSKIAVIWLKAIVTTHAAHMISQPRIRDALAPILSIIDAKQMLLADLSKLKGRVDLVVSQISRSKKQDITDECLLVYQDQDSSEEDIDFGKVELGSESDDNWEETSDQERMQEDVENGKSDEDASIYSSD
ncbi:WD repeat-containing protein 43 [Copidosoma floridanum]|uniref:WD repeat-containing protein 43 n=1 Tax=Copidosoma floridanum TaxID=29053 RepID=UPI0006C940DB|nr:WD repeat-containing protein 43 [Copidosoma floridanum]